MEVDEGADGGLELGFVCECVRRTMCVFLVTALFLRVLAVPVCDCFGPASGQHTRP